MAKIIILHQSEAEVPGPEGKPQIYTYITYKDEAGLIGFLVIPKKAPTDADIREAIRKQREEEAKRRPKELTV